MMWTSPKSLCCDYVPATSSLLDMYEDQPFSVDTAYSILVLSFSFCQFPQAAEVFEKLGDHKSLVSLYVDSFQWDNVSSLPITSS